MDLSVVGARPSTAVGAALLLLCAPLIGCRPPTVLPSALGLRVTPFNLAAVDRPTCLRLFSPDGARCADAGPDQVLSPEAAAAVVDLLNAPASYGEAESGCFFPHHALWWPGEAAAPAREVTWCQRCSRVEASPTLPAQPLDPMRRGLSEAANDELQVILERELGPLTFPALPS